MITPTNENKTHFNIYQEQYGYFKFYNNPNRG